MKVYIEPHFRGPDAGEGGIRRIVEAQYKWLPELGVDIAETMDDADLVATHAGFHMDVPTTKPWVVHTHGLYWAEYPWPDWCHAMNTDVITAMRRSDHVTAPSEWVAQVLRRGMWLRPTVLPHGVNVEEWKGPHESQGYVIWNKNRPDPICDPAPVNLMAVQATDLRFISTFGTQTNNVQVTGRLPYEALKELVVNAGVYLATTRETFGIGTLEAMAAGVPVVGFDWGGQREIIRHGETGWLVQPGDIQGLEDGVRWALKNRDVVGAKAHADVIDRFTWERAMARYVDLYENVVDEVAATHSGPLVSVVIPCHNLADYLPDAIKSLQDQSMADWEAIIVNDASPDDTAEVAAVLADQDPRVRVVTNESNLYLAGALNRGIASARGAYVLPLDADNMIEPRTLELLSNALSDGRGVDIAYGGARFVLEDGATPDTSISLDGMSKWPGEFSFRGQMLGRNQIPSTALYRRKVWERTGGYRRRYRTAEDADFWTRGASVGFEPKKITNMATLVYRQRSESMSRANRQTDWAAWVPWSRKIDAVPFGVAERPPHSLNEGKAWLVRSYEPVKITVVIPVGLGHEQLVIDALDSVQAQTFHDWECIVVDDTGLPDQIGIPHPWAKVLKTDGARGPAHCRNIALRESNATLFVPLDADDYLQSDALTMMYAVWKQFGGVVYSQWYDDLGDDELPIYDPPDYDAASLIRNGAIHAVTALYPVAAWEKLGGFDENLSHWEDWDFHLGLAREGICGTKIPTPLWTYRKTTGFRREQNQASRGKGKEAILAKWAPYWEGKEELLACRSCPGGGGHKLTAPPAMQQNGAGSGMVAREGYALVEFLGAETGTRRFRGDKTKTAYRFGANPAHRRKYVYQDDVPHLLAFMMGGAPLFREIGADSTEEIQISPTLEAPGPPPAMVAEVTGPPNSTVEGADQPDEMTVKEYADRAATMSLAEVAVALSREKASRNRKGVLTVLEARKRRLASAEETVE